MWSDAQFRCLQLWERDHKIDGRGTDGYGAFALHQYQTCRQELGLDDDFEKEKNRLPPPHLLPKAPLESNTNYNKRIANWMNRESQKLESYGGGDLTKKCLTEHHSNFKRNFITRPFADSYYKVAPSLSNENRRIKWKWLSEKLANARRSVSDKTAIAAGRYDLLLNRQQWEEAYLKGEVTPPPFDEFLIDDKICCLCGDGQTLISNFLKSILV